MTKKIFSHLDAEFILDHISRNAAECGTDKINGYARGFLITLLTALADGSPTTKNTLLEMASKMKTV